MREPHTTTVFMSEIEYSTVANTGKISGVKRGVKGWPLNLALEGICSK
jgi:hypothetical protein